MITEVTASTGVWTNVVIESMTAWTIGVIALTTVWTRGVIESMIAWTDVQIVLRTRVVTDCPIDWITGATGLIVAWTTKVIGLTGDWIIVANVRTGVTTIAASGSIDVGTRSTR